MVVDPLDKLGRKVLEFQRNRAGTGNRKRARTHLAWLGLGGQGRPDNFCPVENKPDSRSGLAVESGTCDLRQDRPEGAPCHGAPLAIHCLLGGRGA